MLRNLTLSCTILASAFVAPLAAAQSTEFGGAPNTVQVSYTDLDLRSPDDQATLGQRVSSAAKKLCKSVSGSTLPLYEKIWVKQCSNAAIRSAEPQMIAATTRATGSPRLVIGGQLIAVSVPQSKR